MSQSALAALLGSKKNPAPTPTASATLTSASAPVATPVAKPAAQTTPPPATPAPAPAVAPGVSAPASPAASLTPVAAAPVAFAPGPNAVAVAPGAAAPPDTLAALLGDFTAAAGKAPRVNPPQAASVLAGPTAKEVAGHPEPPEAPEEKVAPVQKPADVLAAEQAPKARRTAAVVQVELDAALARIAELENALVAAGEKASGVVQAAQDGAPDNLVAEAVALIEQLRAEAAVSLEDNRKAWARVAELEEQLEKVTAGALRAEAFKGDGPQGLVGAPAQNPFDAPIEDLCAALHQLGFEPTLRFVGAQS
jgi:hypothetical protein